MQETSPRPPDRIYLSRSYSLCFFFYGELPVPEAVLTKTPESKPVPGPRTGARLAHTHTSASMSNEAYSPPAASVTCLHHWEACSMTASLRVRGVALDGCAGGMARRLCLGPAHCS